MNFNADATRQLYNYLSWGGIMKWNVKWTWGSIVEEVLWNVVLEQTKRHFKSLKCWFWNWDCEIGLRWNLLFLSRKRLEIWPDSIKLQSYQLFSRRSFLESIECGWVFIRKVQERVLHFLGALIILFIIGLCWHNEY